VIPAVQLPDQDHADAGTALVAEVAASAVQIGEPRPVFAATEQARLMLTA